MTGEVIVGGGVPEDAAWPVVVVTGDLALALGEAARFRVAEIYRVGGVVPHPLAEVVAGLQRGGV